MKGCSWPNFWANLVSFSLDGLVSFSLEHERTGLAGHPSAGAPGRPRGQVQRRGRLPLPPIPLHFGPWILVRGPRIYVVTCMEDVISMWTPERGLSAWNYRRAQVLTRG
jgi:hypothetical protein